MTRYRLLTACLAGLLVSVSAGAQTAHAPDHAAHFQRTKDFALKALAERSRILEVERQCVVATTTPQALRACHESAAGSRESLKKNLKPELEQLRAHR